MLDFSRRFKVKEIGYVAEFCPVCRSVEQFKVTKLVKFWHWYFIPLGKGKVVGYPSYCQVCGLEYYLVYESFECFGEEAFETINKAVKRTNPLIYEQLSDRLELERKVMAKLPIDEDERYELIDELFEVFDIIFDMRNSEGIRFDKHTGISCLLTFIVPLSIYITSAEISNDDSEIVAFFGLIALIVFAIGCGVTTYFLNTVAKRFINKYVYPLMARSLKILEPTEGEIEEVIVDWREGESKLGDKLSASKLIEEIKKVGNKREWEKIDLKF